MPEKSFHKHNQSYIDYLKSHDKWHPFYVDYIVRLEKRKFTGNVILGNVTLHFSEGIIAKIDKVKEPLLGVIEKETVKLK